MAKFGTGQVGDMSIAKSDNRCDIEPQMQRGEERKIFARELKETAGGAQPRAILCMPRTRMLFFQMHKRTGQLNEALVKAMVRALRLQPQMLENIVRLVIVPTVKAREPASVTRVEVGFRLSQVFHHALNPFVFFHRRACLRNYPVRSCARQAAA